MMILLTVISLLRGSGDPDESLIGTKRCDEIDWNLFTILHVVCVIMTFVGILVVKNEYKQKVESGYNFVKGDLEATPKNLFVLVLISFFGSMASALCGIGPGNIFCPILVMIGIEA